MKILVCGGRDYASFDRVCEILDEYLATADIVIQGGARGADALAKRWCMARGIHCAQVDAIWRNGPSAGPARNRAMLLLAPDLVIAFPGGRGTQNMVDSARKAGINTRVVTP